MDKTRMQEFYNIARAAGVDWVYTAYLEDVLLGRPFDEEQLVRQIVDAAMAKRERQLRKRASVAINADCTDTVTEMNKARYFARANGGLYAYIDYIERLVAERKPFNMEDCVETVFNNIMGDYKLRLVSKITITTGTNFGGNDAV